jgi:hypothetical protein
MGRVDSTLRFNAGRILPVVTLAGKGVSGDSVVAAFNLDVYPIEGDSNSCVAIFPPPVAARASLSDVLDRPIKIDVVANPPMARVAAGGGGPSTSGAARR